MSAAKHRPSVPANVDAAIRCALEKLPADRFTSAQDFVRALGDEHFQYGESAAAGAGAAVGPWKRRTMTLAAITAVLTIALGWSLLREPPEPPEPVTRVSVLMGEAQSFHPTFGELDLSTDGSLMVYKGQGDEGQSQLWVRRWDALEATPIRNTEGAEYPTISPDGGEVVFGTGFPGSIRVVPLEGGVLRTLTDSAWCCPSWSPEGDWVYYANLSQGLSRVPASGGPSEVVTQVDRAAGDAVHAFADVLPGGSGVLYQAEGASQTNQRIQALDLETGRSQGPHAGPDPALHSHRASALHGRERGHPLGRPLRREESGTYGRRGASGRRSAARPVRIPVLRCIRIGQACLSDWRGHHERRHPRVGGA